jgi:hypothetical protein
LNAGRLGFGKPAVDSRLPVVRLQVKHLPKIASARPRILLI